MGQTAIFRRERAAALPVHEGNQGLADQPLVSLAAKNGVSPDFQERAWGVPGRGRPGA